MKYKKTISNKLILNESGLKIDKRVFLWKFIEDIYFQYIDMYNAVDEHYIHILLKSGQNFEFDISKINFSEKKLIYYLNHFERKSI